MKKYLVTLILLTACAANSPASTFYPAVHPDSSQTTDDTTQLLGDSAQLADNGAAPINCVPFSTFCVDDRHTGVCTASGHDYWIQSVCYLQENLICTPSCNGPYNEVGACCIWKKQH